MTAAQKWRKSCSGCADRLDMGLTEGKNHGQLSNFKLEWLQDW